MTGSSMAAEGVHSPVLPASSPLDNAHDLLVSLLHWWPYAPHAQCPSLLFGGPTANGKSHLMRRVVESANNQFDNSKEGGMQNGSGEHNQLAAQEAETQVVAVTPSLAQAIAVQNAKDGSTGLRRLLRRAIHEACLQRQKEEAQRKATGAQANRGNFSLYSQDTAVLLVLDHVECYLAHDDTFLGGTEGADAASRGNPAASSSSHGCGDASDSLNASVNIPYSALLADLHTILRSAPPLFTQQECAALRLRRLVFVSLFTGELDEVLPIMRQRYADYALSLPTPTERERRLFFAPYTAAAEGSVKSDTLSRLPSALVDALALRTGGVSYGGLQEILNLALDVCATARPGSSSASFSDSTSTEATATAAAATVAQRILQAYQSSGSVTALEYRRSAGYVDVQATRWDDIAGMPHVKQTLQRLVTDPLRHRNTYRHFQVRPSTGVLLHGPPGTGKTMLAKAMATELNASFVYMDLPELVQAEVGESERRLQAYFDVARERSPAVVFMDEVQAAFGLRYGGGAGQAQHLSSPSRAHSASFSAASTEKGPIGAGTSHDARLVSHLLRLLDAAQQDDEHFVLFVGATNVVHLLDPLLLRAGRLDTLLEVPLPDAEARESLVRRVVYGEWADWFCEVDHAEAAGNVDTEVTAAARDASCRAAPHTSQHQLQQCVESVRLALVGQFVVLSEGFSGAQVRNFTSVFGLQLARRVSRSVEAAEERAAHPWVSQAEPLVERRAKQQRRIQSAIAAFLMGQPADGTLSLDALQLLHASHKKSLL